MDCAGIPEEDEMAINKTEWEQIKVLMRDALAEHDKGNLQRFKSWSPLAAMVAIGLFILTQWNAYTVFRVHTEDRLANIEGRALKAEATSSPATALSQLGEVPQNVFMVAFPALRTISEHSVNEVKPTSAVLHSVAGKLKNTPESAQDYWPTVLQFAHFATQGGEKCLRRPRWPHAIQYRLQSGIRSVHVTHGLIVHADLGARDGRTGVGSA